ncbi:MAG: hypothetical protein ABT05_04335 [Lautropia sp. SCN 66-9]|nr:MAG: hypothetical protein ABT05_04335 [Lautropia sp. SCN 66-9]
MDQKRLILAIAISLAILFGFQALLPHKPALPPVDASAPAAGSPAAGSPAAGLPTAGTPTAGAPVAAPAATAAAAPDKGAVPANVPRLQIAGARVQGSISLLGARLDDVVLRDYRDTIAKDSPLVRLLEPRSQAQPYYVQFGWSAPDGTTVKLPDNNTLWTGSGEVAPGKSAQLTWDNGAGLTFAIDIAVDQNYMFTIHQTVRNATAAPVALFPWARIRRDYTPVTAGYYILHEGMLGVLGGTLKELTYKAAKSDGEKRAGVAFESTGTGGWMGITDKYWLTALVPDQAVPLITRFRHITEAGTDRYQVDFVAKDATTVAPGAEAGLATRLFAGAKEVHLLDRYERDQKIPSFDKAVDFGWFYFLTKPFFYAIDWLNAHLHNFGLAIMVFTVFVKGLFFPLANKSYRSMSKMKLLGPKMTALREQYKDDQAKLQPAIMALYKAEKESFSDLQKRTHEWLQSLLDIQRQTGDSLEFIEHVKVDLFPDAVYVFTPRGQIRAMPRGATIIDFAYSVHTDIGDQAVAARVNQKAVPLRSELQNGDVVEVITDPNSKANPNWLSFVRTGKARAGIRQCLKTLKYKESVDLGRRLLERALAALRIDVAALDAQMLERGARDAGAKSVEELHADIGLGKRLAPVVAHTIALQFSSKPSAATLILPRPAPMQVNGTEGAAVTYSPCCQPLPGDEIIGHLRGGHGLFVHRADCKVAARQRNKDAERWIDVDWAEDVSGLFRSEIELNVRNDRGTLGKVAAEIAASEANIVHVAMEEEARDSATMRFAILIRDRVHLAHVIRNLRRLPEVQRIVRH